MLPAIQDVQFSLDWKNEREILLTTVHDGDDKKRDIHAMPHGTMFVQLLDLTAKEGKDCLESIDNAISYLLHHENAPRHPRPVEDGLSALEHLYKSAPILGRELHLLDVTMRGSGERAAAEKENCRLQMVDSNAKIQLAVLTSNAVLGFLHDGIFRGYRSIENVVRYFGQGHFRNMLKVVDGSQGLFYEIDGELTYSVFYPVGEHLRTLASVYLSDFIQNQITVEKCAHCDRYFVPINHAEFCGRIADLSTGKTCAQYGPQERYQQSLLRDPAKGAYRRAYKMQSQRKRSGAIAESDFNIWKEEAKRKIEDVRNGMLTMDEYEVWLKRMP